MTRIPKAVTREFNDYMVKVLDMFLVSKNPVGSTAYWLRRLHPASGFNHREHRGYRRLLRALNILSETGKIRAIRTGEDTVWYLPYSDYKCDHEHTNRDE